MREYEEKKNSQVVEEFSRFAHQYDKYNVIQAQVAQTLVANLPAKKYSKVLDLGCGSGEVFKNFQKQEIIVENFVAFDSAWSMLERHPKTKEVSLVCANFNENNFVNDLPIKTYDVLISSSALQWSEDLDFTLEQTSALSEHFHAAFFTSGTFKTLHETANIASPVYTAKTIEEKLREYYAVENIHLHHYRLEFKSTRDMFTSMLQLLGIFGGDD